MPHDVAELVARAQEGDREAFDELVRITYAESYTLALRLMGNEITTPTIVLVALLLISGSQFTLFAMWFDMESNKDLR